jgi:hypothetical protein
VSSDKLFLPTVKSDLISIQQLQHGGRRLPGGGEAIEMSRPTDGVGAERNALDDIGASAKTSVDDIARARVRRPPPPAESTVPRPWSSCRPPWLVT